MKIMMVAPLPPPYGGIANWMLLLRQQMEQDNDTTLTALINTAPKKGTVIGRSLWDRVVGQGLDMFRLRRAMRRSIRKERPDVIHMTTSGGLSLIRDIFLLKALRRYRIPVAYHLHFGRVPSIAAQKSREWRRMQKAMSLADTVIAIDQRTFDTLCRETPEMSVQYIPNFIDTAKLPQASGEVVKEVVYVGWCIRTKGMEELLAAWETLHARYPEWTLRLVGPYDESYVQTLRERFPMDGVMFAGEQPHDEAMRLLSKAAVFTLPSHTEGFPNVVLEAMAYGKPIVATDVGAIGHILDKDAGVVIPARDVKALTNALDGVMANSATRDELGARAKEQLEARYTVQVVYRHIKNIWGELRHDII